MMIPFIITGDTHNEYGRFLEIINVMGKYSAVKEKYICIAGDFGYLYRDTPEEHLVLDEMEQQDFVFVVIPGNHENYPAFQQYEIVIAQCPNFSEFITLKNPLYSCREG